MRNPLVVLLLLLGPVAQAAPRAGGHRPEAPLATTDPLSPELPTLPLLRSAVRSLGPPEQDVEAMTREQALLYLFVLHDHDRSGRLDGLELLQLLGTVLAQRDGGWPDPDTVTMLVDQALERQDLSRDGLLDPPELLLLPSRGGPPGQPLQQQLGELLAGAVAVPGVDTAMPGGDAGVSGPGHGPAGGQAATQAEAPNAEGMEVEEAPEPEGPDTEAVEAEEAPEIEAPEGEAAPVWGDPGEG
ncbi:cell growth regulator with EF hand domain protein 1 [Harpia harpyja]|uniref:cell growth regulator with EF hand domain protein 1 n=1 Tax=Harpia harpyja TaxID=202280 RepID=UPI0022B0BE88|nr:cell growth regulator with EF hand domain protein 1 [Harpia harpyja]XP_052666215.1 cell growth regulator with EF hand domain protein 1 [Harpia harpyja]